MNCASEVPRVFLRHPPDTVATICRYAICNLIADSPVGYSTIYLNVEQLEFALEVTERTLAAASLQSLSLKEPYAKRGN